MPQRFTFRTDAAATIGFGHLRRCLTLAEVVSARGHEVTFLLSGLSGETASELISRAGFRIRRIGGTGSPSEEAEVLSGTSPGASDILIADMAHSRVLAERDCVSGYLRALRRLAQRLVVIEGLDLESLLRECDGIADLLITPYACDRPARPSSDHTRHLAGACYAVVDSVYGLPRERTIAAEGRKILVTTGGADPAGVAQRVLAAAALAQPAGLQLRVIVGPFFTRQLRQAVAALAARSPHTVSLVEAPADLRDDMLWCDLAVSTSGLTKYELAATGTPAILLSHDSGHARNNVAFAELGTARDLGELGRLTDAEIAESISELIGDAALRSAMSERGRQAVDGRGAARIADAIEDIAA